MDNEMRQMNEVISSHSGEEETAPELQRVRNLLICLPRVSCPAGFEFRLQRRLDGAENGNRPTRERMGWGMGWAGLGLGFAAALLVAVVAFDFSFTSPQIAGAGPAVTSTTQPHNTSQPAEPNLAGSSVQGPAFQQSTTTSEAESQMAAAKRDSNTSKNPPSNLPENLYHMVGGNNP